MKDLYTVKKAYKASVEIKKSQFISYLVPSDRFDEFMEKIKAEHPKGRHFVWAYRTLNDKQQIEENSSDDGEPKNTSGKPTLKVLQGNMLVNTAIITVRYFGGTKLGTGGLVRAYNDAAQKAVSLAEKISMDSLNTLTIKIPYTMTRQTEYQIEKLELTVLSKDFDADTVTISLQGESEKLDELNNLINPDT